MRLACASQGGRSHLTELRQQGCAKARLPTRRDGVVEAVLINSSGGMTGGDRLSWSLDAREGASLIATTQGAERCYRSTEGHALNAITLKAGTGARLAWLPQETILFNNSALNRRLEMHLAPDAEALIVEPLVLGRQAMGEVMDSVRFRDDWRIFRAGELVHAEAFALNWRDSAQSTPGQENPFTLSGAASLATLLLISPTAEEFLRESRRILGENGGASAWNDKLLIRLLAHDSYTLRKRLVPLIELLSPVGNVPKQWSL